MIDFISMGPGDTEMVTLGTLRLLKDARKIYCFETDGASRVADIIASLDGVDVNKIVRIDVPMSKDRSKANKVYDDLAETLSHEEGGICVATEGDSSIFATTHYVMDRLLAMGVECRQHPGIPSFIAAAAVGGLHLISQQQRLTIIPGKTSITELESLLAGGHNIVIMKLSMAHDTVAQFMYMHHELTYHYFENVGTSQQTYRQLTDVPAKFPYFSLLIISRSAKLL